MKIVVTGGTGLIGSKLVNKLREYGHEPMAADDVASGMGKIAVGPAVNIVVEIGGPEQFRLDETVRRRLVLLRDPREVIADPKALYAGVKIGERTLVPDKNARLGETRFETWVTQSSAQIPSARA